MRERRILLVAREGMDWRMAGPLADSGLLPTLAGRWAEGSRGPLAGIPQHLSAMHATCMATGFWPHEHGIIDPPAGGPVTGGPRVISSGDRLLPAFWNILSSAGLHHQVVGWPVSYPAEPMEGILVSDRWLEVPREAAGVWLAAEDAVHPARWSGRLAGCRARIEEIDLRLLGLFFPHAAEMDLARAPLALRLVRHLARLYTTHNTAMALLEDAHEAGRPWRTFAVFDSFLESMGRDFMKFRGEGTGTTERERRWYGAVMEGAYRLHDALLGEMLAMAGDEVTFMLVSDRGFGLRPRGGGEQVLIGGPGHPPGMVLVAGPGIHRGGTLHPASVLDVTPTLLHLLGLPVGRDMAGRAWSELEVAPRPVEMIESWVPRCAGFPRADAARLEVGSSRGGREFQLNLGLSLIAAGRPARAVGPLYRAMAACPENPLAGYHLALALIACGLKAEARDALEALFDLGEDDVNLRQHMISLAIQCEDMATAARLLEHPGNLDAASGELLPTFNLLQGLLALHQGDAALAEKCCRRALDYQPGRPDAWLALARCLVIRGEFDEAEAAALRALETFGRHPLASLTFAQCAAHRGDSAAAATHAAEALEQEPDLEQPRSILMKYFPEASSVVRDRVIELLQQALESKPFPGNHLTEARAQLNRARRDCAAKRHALRRKSAPLHRYLIPR